MSALRLPPPGLGVTRDQLHQIAFFAISPARYQAKQRMGLRATPGGFGTPPFDGRVARIEGDLLVHETPEGVATRTVTTIREAASFFGVEYRLDWFSEFRDPPPPMDPDRILALDREATALIAEWFAFAFSVLEEFRSAADPGEDPSEVQLWPEHFDAATEVGRAEAGRRASFGLSPGDGPHPEPYAYVAAWEPVDRDEAYWNDGAFNGASLDYRDLLATTDPRGMVLDFLDRGRRLLAGDR